MTTYTGPWFKAIVCECYECGSDDVMMRSVTIIGPITSKPYRFNELTCNNCEANWEETSC